MMRRSVVLMACLGGLVGGCGRSGPEPDAAAVLPAETAPELVPEVPVALTESFVDPILGVTIELPAGWSEAPDDRGDDEYVVTFQKDRADGPVVRIEAMPKADYLEIQKVLEIEQQPAAARVKQIAKEMVASLAENETEPEIVSDETWTTQGIIAGRRIIAQQSDPVGGANQGEILVGESAGGGLYTILTTSQPADETGRTQAKQLLDSLTVTDPAASLPDSVPAAGGAAGDPADGIDAGAGADGDR